MSYVIVFGEKSEFKQSSERAQEFELETGGGRGRVLESFHKIHFGRINSSHRWRNLQTFFDFVASVSAFSANGASSAC